MEKLKIWQITPTAQLCGGSETVIAVLEKWVFILAGLAGVYTNMFMVITIMKWNLVSNKCYVQREKYLKYFWSSHSCHAPLTREGGK